MSDQSVVAVGFVVYSFAIAAMGIAAYRRTHDASGFILGDRRLSYWVTALSAGASDMSGWLLLGLPGLAYVSFYESAWVATGLLVGSYLNWLFIARPLREQSARYGDALTIPEFFERRFADSSHVLRTLSASCILLFFVFYTGAGLVAGGKLFEASFGLPYPAAVLIGAVLIVAYTSFGGFLAVAWTDALQAILMFFALLTVAGLAMGDAGGDFPPRFPSDWLAKQTPNETPASWLAVSSALAWGLGYFGQPHILARFMAIGDSGHLGAARRLATGWTGVALCAAIAVGVSGHWELDPRLLVDDSEKVFIHLINALLHPAIAGICLAAILAAIMSTADSQLLVAAAALTHDLLPGNEGNPPHQRLYRHRGAVVLICVFATALALDPGARVLDMVAYAWAGFGAAIGPCVIMSLYSADTKRWSALAGMLVGATTVVVWERLEGGVFDVYALLPGFGAGLATILVGNQLARVR